MNTRADDNSQNGPEAAAAASTDSPAATNSLPESTQADAPLVSGAPSQEGAQGASAGAIAEQLSDEEIQKRQAEFDRQHAEHMAAVAQLRADTPTQTVKIRPEPKGKLMGMIVRTHDQKIRTARLEDWRTEQVDLQVGDHVIIVVLAGDDLTTFENMERREKEQNAPAAAPTPEVEG